MKTDINIHTAKYNLKEVVEIVSVLLSIFVVLNVVLGPEITNILAILLAIGGLIANKGWSFMYNADKR